MSHQTAYLARNVVNAPEIKARITERSRQRGDSQEIATWLQNHFYRYVVGNLVAPPPAVQPLYTVDDLQQRYRNGPPAWAMAVSTGPGYTVSTCTPVPRSSPRRPSEALPKPLFENTRDLWLSRAVRPITTIFAPMARAS